MLVGQRTCIWTCTWYTVTKTRNYSVKDSWSQGCQGFVPISGVVVEEVPVVVHPVEGKAIHQNSLEVNIYPPEGVVVNTIVFN